MEKTRIKISSVVESQLPSYVRDDFPLVSELLTEYYQSLESKGSPLDIIQNIDQYIKTNELYNVVETTTLTNEVNRFDDTISVSTTEGFPKSYGLILVNNEIILYKSKTSTSFIDCSRGFSGITEYSVGNSEDFTFSSSETVNHANGSTVKNLSSLFLKEFFNKVKGQFAFGFENRELDSDLNQNIFVKQSKDFYSSKGSERSFEILFRVLYGKDVEVVLPRKDLFRPSDAQYRVTRNIVVESVQGNPEDLLNQTIQQNQFDGYDSITRAFGTVTDTKKIVRDGIQYTTLMLDYDFDKDISVQGSVFGDLPIHPKTSVLDDVEINSDKISVDSTIGFPKKGEISFNDTIISYDGTTVNQFLNCKGIDLSIPRTSVVGVNTYAFGYDKNGSEIRFKVTGVLSDVDISEPNIYYDKGDVGRIINLGYTSEDPKDKNWIFNVSVKCNVSEYLKIGNNKYKITTIDDNGLYNGDLVEVEYSYVDGNLTITEKSVGDVFISNETVPGRVFNVQNLELNGNDQRILSVKKLIGKYDNGFLTDVLNVYKDTNSDIRYVTSNSIPKYQVDLNINQFKYNLNGNFTDDKITINNHGFFTGDVIAYNGSSSGISTSIYYVKKESDNEIKISRTRLDIENSNFISTTSSLSGDTISLFRFSKNDNNALSLDGQRLVRSIETPLNDGIEYDTLSGTTGILVNGVEILNYKSPDNVYYGPIKSIDVISTGDNYDIITPPVITVSDDVGVGASIFCAVEGKLERIDILDPGFNFTSNPVISISGGGGIGAKATARLVTYDHESFINASDATIVVGSSHTIGFSTYHKFSTGESVIYQTGGSQAISGLSTASTYFVNVVNDFNITLHKNKSDALSGVSTISVENGVGNHSFKSTEKKKKLNAIVIDNPGSGYKNKKISVNSTGINTFTDTINVYSHPYQSGEIVKYFGSTETVVSGLAVTSYVVTRIDDKSFKLSSVGIGTTGKFDFYNSKKYINLTSSGVGTHTFNYEPITISISGSDDASNSNITPVLQGVFRGNLTSIYVNQGGVGYGSSEIINYNKQPDFILNKGINASVYPIVSGGTIKEVVVLNGGENYTAPPDIVLSGIGTGIGAILSPVISSDGILTEVKVINPGMNYTQSELRVEIIDPITDPSLKSYPQVWNINTVERLKGKNNRLITANKLNIDDSVIYEGISSKYELQCCHSYAPRNLRRKIYSKSVDDGVLRYKTDYSNDIVNTKKYHSPIIGWSYDGNPIYGPYGYDTIDNRKVRQMTSGYELLDQSDIPNRPSVNIFPLGHFVEDYSFKNSGDLDRHNGRYTVTPDYPNGVYAYFTTLSGDDISKTALDNDRDCKDPVFPYIIGNTYKSKPIPFNYESKSNQETFEFNENNLIRNTNSYNSFSETSSYEYFLSRENISDQNAVVQSASKGKINSIQIVYGGKNYKVNDVVNFDNAGTGGSGASARVEYLDGKSISQISQETRDITDVELYPIDSNTLIGICSDPHNLNDKQDINLNSLTRNDFSLNGIFNVGITSSQLLLNSPVAASTGLVTFFSVSGDLTKIEPNDVFTVDTEDITVLNVDLTSSRIRVLRTDDTVTHASYSSLVEKSRKFTIKSLYNLETKKYKFNKELYFDPSESLGIGTISSGIHTLSFSNPGSGITSIQIPTRSIYIRNHGLETNDELLYRDNGGTPITISQDGDATSTLADESTVFAAKITDDLIGISTFKVGLGTTGGFVGINTTDSILYFTAVGAGSTHSFTTRYSNVSKANVSISTVTVSTATTHKLQIGDEIFLTAKPGITTSIKIKYDEYNRRLIIKPRTVTNHNYSDNILTINDHGYTTGQKIVYTATAHVPTGLSNNGIYYVIVYDRNRIKLSESSYGTNSNTQEEISISLNRRSPTSPTVSEINPNIKIDKNQVVEFDLSDGSLSDSNGISLFDFNLYRDNNLSNVYLPVNSNRESKIIKTGTIGNVGAKVTINVDDEFPDRIFYQLDKIKNSIVYRDSEFNNSNTITFTDSPLNGKKKIIGVGSDTFEFLSGSDFRFSTYSETDGSFNYYTNSINETGTVKEIEITSGGKSYVKLPSISSITSATGSGIVAIPASNTIGRINKVKISEIGYNYPADKTLIPTIKFASMVRVEPLSTINTIEVISPGLNYITEPDLVVIDGFTNKLVSDAILDYDIESRSVSIVLNSKGFYDAEPRIVAVNNTNGLGIGSITYDSSSKQVTAYFTKQFSSVSEYPFEVGDNVYIEGITVANSTDKGYNSKNYDYNLFPITAVNASSGGSGASIVYSMSDYLTGSSEPGIAVTVRSSGRAISDKELPSFKITLKKNDFIVGENVKSNNNSGRIIKWNPLNEYLTVELIKDFKIGDTIIGSVSSSKASVKDIIKYETFYDFNSSSVVEDGWNRNTGYLNETSQRIFDSDYYQYFSYALKSEVPLQTWDQTVNNLNHTLGFKRFSNLVISSTPGSVGLAQTEATIGIADLNSTVDVECLGDFDLVTENHFYVESTLTSDEISFNSVKLKDFSNSNGNRVLSIDDISLEFNTNLSETFVTAFNI